MAIRTPGVAKANTSKYFLFKQFEIVSSATPNLKPKVKKSALTESLEFILWMM